MYYTSTGVNDSSTSGVYNATTGVYGTAPEVYWYCNKRSERDRNNRSQGTATTGVNSMTKTEFDVQAAAMVDSTYNNKLIF